MTSVYVFSIILAVLLAAVLIAPLLERPGGEEGHSSPSGRLESALEALREIEFEHETGKIGDADYKALRGRFAAEAIAARDAGGSSRSPADGGTCPICEAGLEPSARFCSRCGTEVNV